MSSVLRNIQFSDEIVNIADQMFDSYVTVASAVSRTKLIKYYDFKDCHLPMHIALALTSLVHNCENTHDLEPKSTDDAGWPTFHTSICPFRYGIKVVRKRGDQRAEHNGKSTICLTRQKSGDQVQIGKNIGFKTCLYFTELRLIPTARGFALHKRDSRLCTTHKVAENSSTAHDRFCPSASGSSGLRLFQNSGEIRIRDLGFREALCNRFILIENDQQCVSDETQRVSNTLLPGQCLNNLPSGYGQLISGGVNSPLICQSRTLMVTC
ncbi:hypothetical protein CLF_105705 [Clonorchis sinensis]|uniref:Uncharacterized protein n=1 Tax=Clonorchis sinensis TaxID=79923 RepID=G7YE12_CLOSI|nr:hypothetical protein CLF_105705 [Clonorchis sinensis]